MDDIISLVYQKSALNLCFVSLGCGRGCSGKGSVPGYPQQSASASWMLDFLSYMSKNSLNLRLASLGCGRSGRGEGGVPAYPQQSASASLALDFLSYIRKISLNFRPVSVCAGAWRGWQGGGDGAGRPERNLEGDCSLEEAINSPLYLWTFTSISKVF